MIKVEGGRCATSRGRSAGPHRLESESVWDRKQRSEPSAGPCQVPAVSRMAVSVEATVVKELGSGAGAGRCWLRWSATACW